MRPLHFVTGFSTPLIASVISLSAFAASPSSSEIIERLERLEREQAQLKQQLQSRDARISELEKSAAPDAIDDTDTASVYGAFIPGRGFRIANTDVGTVEFSAYTYLRYLNQDGLDDDYRDHLGTVKAIDERNDLQVQKLVLYFKGWVYDPALRYVFYTWTSNTSQGDGAQVVVAGYLTYHVSDALNFSGGISGLPSTRSLEGQWPNFLKVDYRTIADEYFRGSYTTGFFVNGALADGALQYKAMIGNNLSQLGVNGPQMDDTFDTVALALWWMPTTGEYGPNQGFGDFEMHDRLATRVGVHYTHSTEDKQSQPGKEDPENSQIRLSDGAAIFDQNIFGAGVQINKARYQMGTLDAGLKFRGFALEGEYFWRWVDKFDVTGTLPFDDLYDHGYQLQASMMVMPKLLQIYLAGSQINGEYGDPSDVALGVNWFPLRDNRKLRVNGELLQLNDSPVGYSSVPFAVGGDGLVIVSHLELAF